jgi:hypothetical protein
MITQHQEWHDELEPREECADINALRIKFLSEGYRLKFAFIAGSISQQMLDHVYITVKNNIIHYLDKCYAPVEIHHHLQERYLKEHVNFDYFELSQMGRSMRLRIESLQQRIKNELKQELAHKRLIALEEHKKEVWKKLNPVSVCVSPVEFERNNIDIYFSSCVSLKLNNEIQSLLQSERIISSFFPQEHAIEIRSTIGDEFPSILRKMKSTHANALFLAHYIGRGVTRRQFIDFFASQHIKVIFANDVERFMLPTPELKIIDNNVLAINDSLAREFCPIVD